MFNDLLGTTLGKYDGEKFIDNRMTAFGESVQGEPPAADFFFTGKPKVEGLGYAFLFRNYRGDLGKWQTSDPIGFALLEPKFYKKNIPEEYQLGYPDGWNNLAYVNNGVINALDQLGAWKFVITGSSSSSTIVTVGSYGGGMFYNYVTVTAAQGASGDGTAQLTIVSSGSFSYKDTPSGIDVSIGLSFTTIFTVNAQGEVSSQISGDTSKTQGNLSISASGGGASSLTITGIYAPDSSTMYAGFAVATGINFTVKE